MFGHNHPHNVYKDNRNTIVSPPASDTDHGPGTAGTPVAQPSKEEIALVAAARFHHLMQMMQDQGFDYTHPVDEYAPQGGNAVLTNQVVIQPDYDMPERITCITAIIPVAATLATLQLGQRIITLYSGAALATPLVINLPNVGMIINADDQRVLNITGAITSPPYLGLTGWALTRGQFS